AQWGGRNAGCAARRGTAAGGWAGPGPGGAAPLSGAERRGGAGEAAKTGRGFARPAACRDNTRERIARALAPAREEGLLPPFPFGSDFTATEERLIPALKRLRSASPLRLAGLLARGFFASRPRASCATASRAWGSTIRPVRWRTSKPRCCMRRWSLRVDVRAWS